jgi:hypothetical protein
MHHGAARKGWHGRLGAHDCLSERELELVCFAMSWSGCGRTDEREPTSSAGNLVSLVSQCPSTCRPKDTDPDPDPNKGDSGRYDRGGAVSERSRGPLRAHNAARVGTVHCLKTVATLSGYTHARTRYDAKYDVIARHRDRSAHRSVSAARKDVIGPCGANARALRHYQTGARDR